MNITFDTLNYTRKPPENRAGLVADVEDCLGDNPHPDELLQRDAVHVLWDEGRALDPEAFEAIRVFAIGRLSVEFLRHVMPEPRQGSFLEQCIANIAPPLQELPAIPPGNDTDTAGLLLGDLTAKSFVTGWPSDTPKDEGVPLATRLIANTFSIVAPGSEGHIPREYVPIILSEQPGRTAAQAGIFGGSLRMLQVALAKRYAAQTGERPGTDLPIKEIADARTISKLNIFYASYQATKLHVTELNLDSLWERTELINDSLVLDASMPEQRSQVILDQHQVIRKRPVGCPGSNITGAIAFVCDASKTIVNGAQERLLNPVAAPLPQSA